MTDKKNNAQAPNKPIAKPTQGRGRARKVRIEDHPDVQAWCNAFINQTENEHGFSPTQDQAIQAFLVAALKGIGKGES